MGCECLQEQRVVGQESHGCAVKLGLILPLLASMRSGFLQQFLAAWERELLSPVTQKHLDVWLGLEVQVALPCSHRAANPSSVQCHLTLLMAVQPYTL